MSLVSKEVAELEFGRIVNSSRKLKNADWESDELRATKETTISLIMDGYAVVSDANPGVTIEYELERPLTKGENVFLDRVTFRNRISKAQFDAAKEAGSKKSKSITDKDKRQESESLHLVAFVANQEKEILDLCTLGDLEYISTLATLFLT